MTAMGKNGQPSMEEILASIRRIVADDPSSAAPLIDLNRRPAQDNRLIANGQSRVDDSPDFELPSMFKSGKASDSANLKTNGAQAAPKSAQIGRLTDAIRNVAPKTRLGAATGVNSGQPDDGANGSQHGSSAAGDTFGRRPDPTKSLSSLRQPGIAGPTPCSYNGAPAEVATVQASAAGGQNGSSIGAAKTAPAQTQNGAAFAAGTSTSAATTPNGAQQTSQPQTTPSQTQSASAKDPPRVMAAFRDTRMVRMARDSDPNSAATAAVASKEAAPQPQTGTQSSAIGSIVPGAMDLPGRTPGVVPSAPASQGTEVGSAPPAQTSGPAAQSPATETPSTTASAPPPLPEGDEAQASGPVEDATADLLRPMLRQWLSENMPRMVEKALHIEVAASNGSNEPDDGSAA